MNLEIGWRKDMLLFKNGELVDRLIGNQPKPAIINKLEPHF